MKLYFSPGACSLSAHIALREAGLEFEIEQVNLATKKTKSGADFNAINPKGYVPTLVLDGGEVLTEGPAIVQYIADLRPDAKLAPPAGTLARVRLQEWLGFINSEIHKAFAALFDGRAAPEVKQAARDKIARRLDFTAASLDGKAYLLGDTFSVADGYLFTVLRWTHHGAIELARWKVLTDYVARVAARPAVAAALAAEGLRTPAA
jgi:glutathione S-transferase